MTTKTKDKITPLQSARAYAEAHPEFEGEVRVTTLRERPGGRWGWKSSSPTQQTSRVRVAGGRAALITILRGKNGPCRACGRVILEPVLTDAYRRDERAGQPLVGADLERWKRYESDHGRYVYDYLCRVCDVCPACVEALGLGPYPNERRNDWPPKYDGWKCMCAPAGFVACDRRPPVVTIDLTKSGGEVVE